MLRFIVLNISVIFFLFSVKSTKAESYIEYNLEILNAQNFIISNNLDNALISYKSAFTIVTKPFPKDYRNAALTAYYNDSIALMKVYLENAVINGYHWKKPFKHLIKRSFNFYFKKDKIFLKHLETKCEKMVKINFENPVFSKYKDLFDKDQKARKGISKKKKQLKMKISDESIYTELIKDGINKGFYPGYITAGTYSYIDLSYAFAMHLTIVNYETIIINALKNGEITPYTAGAIYARQYSNLNNGSCCTKFPNLIMETNCSNKKEKDAEFKEMGFKFNSFI